jgi:PAS domain-containing protein
VFREGPRARPPGAVVGCIGLGLDITGAVHSVRRNVRLSRQLEFAQRVGRIGSWVVDLTSGRGLWSDEAFRVLWLETNTIPPTFDAFSHVDPDDRERMARIHRRGVRTGKGYDVHNWIVRGAVRQLRAVIEFDTDDAGEVTRIAGILQDTTPEDDPRTNASASSASSGHPSSRASGTDTHSFITRPLRRGSKRVASPAATM